MRVVLLLLATCPIFVCVVRGEGSWVANSYSRGRTAAARSKLTEIGMLIVYDTDNGALLGF